MTIAASASTVPVEQNRPAKADDQHFRIRAERYRYIRCRNGEEELYDHLEDPYEWKNLAEDPEQSRVLNAMRKQMKNYIQAHRQP